MVAVEGYGLYIYITAQQLCLADPDVGGVVQDLLGAPGQVDPQVLNTILIPTGVGDLACMDGHRLLTAWSAALGVRNLLRHWNTSRFEDKQTLIGQFMHQMWGSAEEIREGTAAGKKKPLESEDSRA